MFMDSFTRHRWKAVGGGNGRPRFKCINDKNAIYNAITTMFITNFYEATHFWCYDVLFFSQGYIYITEHYSLNNYFTTIICAGNKRAEQFTCESSCWKCIRNIRINRMISRGDLAFSEAAVNCHSDHGSTTGSADGAWHRGGSLSPARCGAARL